MNFLSNLVNRVLVYYKPTLCKENVAFVKHQKIGKREYENKEKRVKKYLKRIKTIQHSRNILNIEVIVPNPVLRSP